MPLGACGQARDISGELHTCRQQHVHPTGSQSWTGNEQKQSVWRPNRRKKRRLICLCLSFFLPPPSPRSPVSLVVSVSCRCCLRKFSTHAGGKVTQFVSVPPTDGPYDAVTAKELCNCRLLFLSARTHGCRLITVLLNVQLFFNPVQTSLLSCLGAKTVASTATLREGCLLGSSTSQTARKNVDVNCLNLTATMCPRKGDLPLTSSSWCTCPRDQLLDLARTGRCHAFDRASSEVLTS